MCNVNDVSTYRSIKASRATRPHSVLMKSFDCSLLKGKEKEIIWSETMKGEFGVRSYVTVRLWLSLVVPGNKGISAVTV